MNMHISLVPISFMEARCDLMNPAIGVRSLISKGGGGGGGGGGKGMCPSTAKRGSSRCAVKYVCMKDFEARGG